MESSNVVQRAGTHLFIRICQLVLGRVRYNEEITLFKNIRKYVEPVVAILRMGEDEPKLTYMFAYTCTGNIPNTNEITTKYKIAGGPNETSLIVLRETDCLNNNNFFRSQFDSNNLKCYDIIELIEYMTPHYIDVSF